MILNPGIFTTVGSKNEIVIPTIQFLKRHNVLKYRGAGWFIIVVACLLE